MWKLVSGITTSRWGWYLNTNKDLKKKKKVWFSPKIFFGRRPWRDHHARLSCLSSLTSQKQKKTKKQNIQLRLGELCSFGTGSWPFLRAAGGFYYFSGRRRGFAAPEMKWSQSLPGTLLRVSPPNAMALFAEGQSLPSLRAIRAALWRRRAGVPSRADEVIYMVPGCSLCPARESPRRRERPASRRGRDSLACILSCAAHNSRGPDYFVWSARSTLSLGLIIATTHFGVRHSVRHGLTFVPFKGEMFCSPLAHLVRTEGHVFINIHEAYESSRDC